MRATSQDGPIDLTLRPATLDDASTVADLFGSVRAAAVPLMPPAVHTPEEDQAHFRGLLEDDAHECWLAEADGETVGFAIFTATWLDHLYVAPAAQGRGIGSALLELVKSLRPGGLDLWVFESNLPARRLYAAHGFVEAERTDGSQNIEKAPDIRMAWPA